MHTKYMQNLGEKSERKEPMMRDVNILVDLRPMRKWTLERQMKENVIVL
jgi:hypothetical protein